MVCRVSIEDTRQGLLCRVPNTRHSAKNPLCRVPVLGSRQRLTAVSFRTAANGPLPSAFFAECLTLGKHVFAECGSCAECPALDKEARYREPNFAECGSRQILLCRVPDKRHSAKRPTLGKASDSGSVSPLTLMYYLYIYTCTIYYIEFSSVNNFFTQVKSMNFSLKFSLNSCCVCDEFDVSP
jgi:hypothetical protein